VREGPGKTAWNKQRPRLKKKELYRLGDAIVTWGRGYDKGRARLTFTPSPSESTFADRFSEGVVPLVAAGT